MGYFVSDVVTPHPYIRVTDMHPGRVDMREVKYVPEAAFPPIRNYRIYKDDLFISVAGTLGIVGKIPDALDGANLTENANRISAIECDRDFLLHVMLSPVVQNFIESERTVGAQPKLALARIRKFSIPLPPSDIEQSAIATALGDVDALLAAQDALIAKKRAIKQGAMQELLTGKRRLPGFSGEWEVKQLHTVLRFQVGFPFSSSYFNRAGDGVRLVKNRDLKADDQVFHYSGGGGADFLVKNGDVLIGMDGDFLPCFWDKGEALLNQRVGRIVPSKHLDLTYAYYRLQEPLKVIEAITSSTTVKHLSHGDLEEIELPLPRVEEQAVIARVLSDIDAELTALETQRAKTTQLKQGMMQALLTGRIRLI